MLSIASCNAKGHKRNVTNPMQELMQYLIREGRAWIRFQRDALRPLGVTLEPELKNFYSAYFELETLDDVVICDRPRIENPPFYRDLAQQGISVLLDFTQMSGITFNDTIVIAQGHSGPHVPALLFHECVHVVQYRKLGIDRFVEQYINGWAENNYDYYSIPLEREAYDLQKRFSRGDHFSVEATVAG